MKKTIRSTLLGIALLLCVASFGAFAKPVAASGIDKGQIIGSNVYMRKTADAGSAVVCKLSKGAVVTVLQTNVNAQWDKVQYNGKTGYVNRTYVSFDMSLDQYSFAYTGIVVNVNSTVTLRSLPATSAAAMGTAKKGQKLTVLRHNYIDGWDQIGFNGKVVYVASKYLNIVPNVGNTYLTGLTISGGTMTPSFSPYEYGYVVKATGSSVTIRAKANSGVSVDINGSGKSSYTVSMASGTMKTLRIKLNGTVRYSVYIMRGVLTVGTWNIKRGDGDLPMQGRLVYNQQPDLLALQEAYRDDTGSAVDNLASLKTSNMPYTKFAKTLDMSGDAQYGIGLLSHYKPGSVQTYDLDSGGYEHRILMKTVVNIGGKKVSIYNTHFTYQSADVRAKQFAQVAAIMKKDTNKYKILFGDFNAQQDEFSPLSAYTMVNTNDTDYVDYFGKSFHNTVIDNILVTKNIKVVNTRAIQTDLSDHNPVFAYLVLK